MASGGLHAGAAREKAEHKASVMMAIIFFMIGLSAILSYNWSETEARPLFDPTTILVGVVIAAIIFVASRVRERGLRLRFCPACGRQIPFDAHPCPYCGRQLP